MFIDPVAGRTIGEFIVRGISSGGTIFSGDTEEAMEKVADAVANYVTG